MLVDMETRDNGQQLVQTIEDLELSDLSPDDDTPSYRSQLLMKVASLLRSGPKKHRLSELPQLANKHRWSFRMVGSGGGGSDGIGGSGGTGGLVELVNCELTNAIGVFVCLFVCLLVVFTWLVGTLISLFI